MAKRSGVEIMEVLLGVLEVLFERTDPTHALSMTEIIDALAERGITAERRSVRRAMDVAGSHGIDIACPSQGETKTGYRLLSRPLSSWQVGFLLDAVAASPILSREERASIRAELLRILPERERLRHTREIETGVEPRSIYSSSIAHVMADLNEAIASKRRVSFTYWEADACGRRSEREVGRRIVEPYAFVFRDGYYYLVSAKVSDDGLAPRTYRLDRVGDVEVIDTLQVSSLSDMGIDLRSTLQESFGMFIDPEPVRVELRVDPRLTKYVAERFGDGAEWAEEGGAVHCSVDVRPSPAFYAWIFQFDGGIRISAPDEVAGEYLDMLSRATRAQLGEGEEAS